MSSNFPQEGKLDPRIKRTRSLLGQALTDVLAEKGFQAVSVQDITEKAGVNRTTFYLHFPDKYALLEYNISQLFHQELDKRMLSICHYTPENLTSLIVTVAEFIQFSNLHCAPEPQFEALVELQVKKQVQAVIEAWGQKTEFGAVPKLIGIATSWAIYGLALEWSRDKNHPGAGTFALGITPIINSILGVQQPAW